MPTSDNLDAAFAGESQANRKYLAFSQKAERDGTPALPPGGGNQYWKGYDEALASMEPVRGEDPERFLSSELLADAFAVEDTAAAPPLAATVNGPRRPKRRDRRQLQYRYSSWGKAAAPCMK